jgi:hypothetical protein
MIFHTSSFAEPDQEEVGAGDAVIKLPPSPGAGTVITNYGPGSGSFLFYQRQEILQKKRHGC